MYQFSIVEIVLPAEHCKKIRDCFSKIVEGLKKKRRDRRVIEEKDDR